MMMMMMIMLRTTRLLLVLLLLVLRLLTSLPFVWTNSNSNVSVNLKSKVLTDILTTSPPPIAKGNDSDRGSSNTSPFPATAATAAAATAARQTSSSSLHGKRDGSDILRLDLSGRLNLHLWGRPSSTEEDGAITRTTAIRPLFPLAASTADRQASPTTSRSSNMIPISVKVGLDYDLSGQQSRHQQQHQQHHHRGWYGVQRVLGTLDWQRQRGRQRRNRQRQEEERGEGKQEHNNVLSLASISHLASKLFQLPRRVQFTVERGINTANIVDASSSNDYNDDDDSTYAAHIKVGWDADATSSSISSSSRLQSPPFIKMGIDWIQNNNNSNNKKPLVIGAMICSIPLHQRFLWRGKISCPLFTTTTNSDFIPPNSISRRIPMPPVSDWNDVSSWLIPDVTVNAMSGQMESNNQAWFSLPTIMSLKKQQEEVRREDDKNIDCDNSRGRGGGGGRLGIRLTIRRHFDFDYPSLLSGLLGSGSTSSSGNSNSMSDHSDSMTAICLEIKGMTPRTITTARFETALEAPLDAAHLSLLQYYLACDNGRQ